MYEVRGNGNDDLDQLENRVKTNGNETGFYRVISWWGMYMLAMAITLFTVTLRIIE